MNVLFLPSGYDGSYYYRGYLPGVYGNMTVVRDFIGKGYDTDEMLKLSMKADAIVFQRPNDPLKVELMKLLKAKGKKIIFDNDDTYLPDKGVPLAMLKSDKQREIAIKMNDCLYDAIKLADLTVASTEPLAEEYRAISDNVVVIGNYIDPLDAMDSKPNNTGKYRVGFIGSVTTNDDYTHIKDQIRKLAERGDTTIVVFGIKKQHGTFHEGYREDAEFWESLPNVEWQQFVHINEYYSTLANLALDLAIIPRKDSYFNRCKSNIKFLECSLLKIPVLAQGFEDGQSPYQANSQDKDFMDIVTDNSQWYDKTIDMLINKEDSMSLAQSAHDYVLERYNINDHAQKWKQVITNL